MTRTILIAFNDQYHIGRLSLFVALLNVNSLMSGEDQSKYWNKEAPVKQPTQSPGFSLLAKCAPQSAANADFGCEHGSLVKKPSMLRRYFSRSYHHVLVFLFFSALNSLGQVHTHFADSIREKYKIPELAYAVISSGKTIELEVLGFHKANSDSKARINDRFRIGSNTKTITSYIAALLVKQGKISYDTKFFDLYPELKEKSNPAYYDLTLQDLLTFRANLISWTYSNAAPGEKEIKGDEKKQRYDFVSWVLRQNPDTAAKITYWSNPSYVAAGLMLEKATGKDYKTLVFDLGKDLNIEFGFGQPNNIDENQPWGHDVDLIPEKPSINYKLNWLSSAGNINLSLPDYAKFIQMQLNGLSGKSEIFTAQEFDYMHYGLPVFSFGWQVYTDDKTQLKYSYHKGNPGTFLSKVYICKDTDRAYIFMTNVQSENAEAGLGVLFDELKKNQVN